MKTEKSGRKTKSAILEAVHDTAKGLHKAGVMDTRTLDALKRLGLTPRESARLDAIIRASEKLSERG